MGRKNKYPKKVTIGTPEGDAEAIKKSSMCEWEITYPWKDDRFFGTIAEVDRRMRGEIEEYKRVEALRAEREMKKVATA